MRNLKKHVSDPIPSDLLVDIFSRVPAQSIARFRCVSKFWASILRRSDFSDLFQTRSSTRPLLLFTFQANGKFIFYSSPMRHPDENMPLVVTRYHRFSLRDFSSVTCSSLRGLVCLQDWQRNDTLPVICNPVTGESITLPIMETKNIYNLSYLGYDPIEKQFKVLSMTSSNDIGVFNTCDEHRILTLETGKKMSWKVIKCKPHYPSRDMICLNGVLYYRADFSTSRKIVCFDVKSEKFNFINMDVDFTGVNSDWTLIDYKSIKLGVLQYKSWMRKELVLWVLEDAGEGIWSRHICVLPPLWDEINGLQFVGMTSIGEIVVSPYRLSDRFYVYYYNPEKNTFKRVNIEGFEESYGQRIHTFSDYIEDGKCM